MNISELRFLVVEDHDFQRSTLVGCSKGWAQAMSVTRRGRRSALDMCSTTRCPSTSSSATSTCPTWTAWNSSATSAKRLRGRIILASAMERAVLASVETMAEAYGITLLGAIEKPVTRRSWKS